MFLVRLLGMGVLVILSFVTSTIKAQDEEPYDYSTEFIWGINKNTRDGLIGGVIFKHSTTIGRDRFRTLGLELINVKHHQEFRFNSFTGNTFIWAKESYLYSIRGQYGRDWVLFKKAPQQGVQINASLAGGPSIGLVAPYYIEVQSAPGLSVTEPFDAEKHGNSFNNILGTGGIFQGLFESKVKLGLNVKSSLSFEFGTFKSNVTGFEAGFLIEAYTSEIVLVPFAENQAIFPTAFITLFYGSRR